MTKHILSLFFIQNFFFLVMPNPGMNLEQNMKFYKNKAIVIVYPVADLETESCSHLWPLL